MLKQKSFYVNELARTGAHHISHFLMYRTMGCIQLMSASSSALPVSPRVANNEGGRVSPHCSPLSFTVQKVPGGCC